MSAEFTLSSEFWAHFVEHHWNKSPLLIKQPFAASFTTPAEIFLSLQRASDQFRAGATGLRVRFLTEDQFLLQGRELGPYLPQSVDQSAADYAERMTHQLKGQRFALIVNEIQIHDAQLWRRTREFLRGLLSRIPAQILYPGVFLGNYEKTPFGIHRDVYHIFMFVIEGRKTARVWPADYFRDEEDERLRLHYEGYPKLVEDAITLEGEPGDLIYWPIGYWHVGEGHGELSLSLSLGLEPVQPLEEICHQLIESFGRRLMSSAQAENRSFDSRDLHASTETVSRALELATYALREVGADPELEQIVRLSWLNRVTGGGFTRLPIPLPAESLDDADVVRGCPDYPIRWMPAGTDDEVICSANGHSFTLAAHPKILQLIERLNTGAAHQVQDLLAEHAGSLRVDDIEFVAKAEEIRALLEKLYSLRAIAKSEDQ